MKSKRYPLGDPARWYVKERPQLGLVVEVNRDIQAELLGCWADPGIADYVAWSAGQGFVINLGASGHTSEWAHKSSLFRLLLAIERRAVWALRIEGD